MNDNGLVFDLFEYIIGYSCMVFILITVPIYTVVIVVLIYGRNHNSTNNVFFMIYLIGGVIDLIAILNNYLGGIFPARGWLLRFYLSSPTIGKVYLMIAWGTRACQGITVLLLAVNRSTAVLNPMAYGRFWSRKVALLAVLFQSVPGVIMGGLLTFTTFYWQQKDDGGWYIQFEDPLFRLQYFKLAFIIQAILMVFISINYILVLYYFRRKYKLITSPLDVRAQRVLLEKQKQEKRLVYISMIVCTMEIIFFCFSVYCFIINTQVPTHIFYLCYNTLNDIYAGTPPYLLLFFSTPFKRRMLSFLGLDDTSKNSSRIIPVNKINSIAENVNVNNRGTSLSIIE